MNNKLKPAIIGGVVLGILSVIPFVNWVNFCCCLWAILGGLVGSFLYIKASPTRANAGDGAIVGALAGVVGALIFIVIGIPLQLVIGALVSNLLADIVAGADPSVARQIRFQAATQSVVGTILRSFIGAIFLIIFSTLGGLLGIPIFEKRKDGVVSPPPQNYG